MYEVTYKNGVAGYYVPYNDGQPESISNDGVSFNQMVVISHKFVEISTQVAQQGYRANMSTEELAIFDRMTNHQQLMYLSNARSAKSMAENLFDRSTLWNGKGDAFRHALFSALNARSLGIDLAKRLGDAHELRPEETELGRAMDLFNNDVGRQIFTILNNRGLAYGHFSAVGYVHAVNLALENGYLREIGGFPVGLVPTKK